MRVPLPRPARRRDVRERNGMTYESLLWLAHEVLLIALGGWLLYLCAEGMLRKGADRGR